MHAGAGDQVRAKAPPECDQPRLPHQQLAQAPGLGASRRGQHVMGDSVGVEQGQGHVLVPGHHEGLVAARVQGGDDVAEHVRERGMADVDEDFHARSGHSTAGC